MLTLTDFVHRFFSWSCLLMLYIAKHHLFFVGSFSSRCKLIFVRENNSYNRTLKLSASQMHFWSLFKWQTFTRFFFPGLFLNFYWEVVFRFIFKWWHFLGTAGSVNDETFQKAFLEVPKCNVSVVIGWRFA